MLFELDEKVQVWDEEEIECLGWGKVIAIVPPLNGEQPIYIVELEEGLLIAVGNNKLGLIDAEWAYLMGRHFYNMIERWDGDINTPAAALRMKPEYVKSRRQFARFWVYDTSESQRRCREKKKLKLRRKNEKN